MKKILDACISFVDAMVIVVILRLRLLGGIIIMS